MSQWDPWEQKPALQSIRLPGLELRNGDRVILRPKRAETSWIWPWRAGWL